MRASTGEANEVRISLPLLDGFQRNLHIERDASGRLITIGCPKEGDWGFVLVNEQCGPFDTGRAKCSICPLVTGTQYFRMSRGFPVQPVGGFKLRDPARDPGKPTRNISGYCIITIAVPFAEPNEWILREHPRL